MAALGPMLFQLPPGTVVLTWPTAARTPRSNSKPAYLACTVICILPHVPARQVRYTRVCPHTTQQGHHLNGVRAAAAALLPQACMFDATLRGSPGCVTLSPSAAAIPSNMTPQHKECGQPRVLRMKCGWAEAGCGLNHGRCHSAPSQDTLLSRRTVGQMAPAPSGRW